MTMGSDYKTIWCPRTVYKTVGYLRWSLRKEERDMHGRGKSTNKCSFNRELMSTVYQSSQWRHTVAVIDRFFYFLDNEDISVFRYPISRLIGKQEGLNYFLRI